mgnify:CR=1 FL=1
MEIVLCLQEAYIILADKLTESPNSEYSLLEPLVPTTPQKTNPVAIPILQLQLSFFNSYLRFKAVITDRTASSS